MSTATITQSEAAITQPEFEGPWPLPSKGRVGMLCFIIAEAAIFTIFVVAYVYYTGKTPIGPTPREVLTVPRSRRPKAWFP